MPNHSTYQAKIRDSPELPSLKIPNLIEPFVIAISIPIYRALQFMCQWPCEVNSSVKVLILFLKCATSGLLTKSRKRSTIFLIYILKEICEYPGNCRLVNLIDIPRKLVETVTEEN